jgi:hypothetical protein
MDIDQEPEIAAIFEGQDVPPWVASAVDAALETTPQDASTWTEALAVAFGRRANRILRERIGPASDVDRL